MKKLILLIAISTLCFANEALMQRIDSIVDIISQERNTISKSKIATLKDPFVKQKIQKSEDGVEKKVITSSKPATPSYENVRFHLSAIVNNKAKINNRWVKTGDTIEGYVVQNIGTNYTKLNYKKFYNKTLYLNRSNNNIINKGSSNEK